MLEFHAEGFRDASVAAVVTNRRFAPIRIVMQISVDTENVTVATGINVPLVSTETSENQNANAIDRDALDRVPVFDQDYITTMSRFLDDNATGTNGVTLVVNGIEANGPGVTPSAVQEVKINNNPYSARFSRPGRARLEIVTKSGTSDYHGELNFMLRNSVFDASNAFAVVKPPESRQYYEGSVTGPIGHSKRTSFLAALDYDSLDLQAIVDPSAIAAAESLGFGPIAPDRSQPHASFLRVRPRVPRSRQRRPILDWILLRASFQPEFKRWRNDVSQHGNRHKLSGTRAQHQPSPPVLATLGEPVAISSGTLRLEGCQYST